MSQSMDWDDVFGKAESKRRNNKQSTSHLGFSVPNAVDANEKVKNVLGQNLLDHMKQIHDMMHAHHLSFEAKKQFKETWDFFLNTIKRDLGYLEDVQLIFMTIKNIVYRLSREQQQELNKILLSLDAFIVYYNAKMDECHVPVFLKANALREQELIATTHQNVLDSIHDGALQKAAVMLLGFHYVYTPEQASLLLEAGKRQDLEYSEAFVAFLNHRLHSQHRTSPDWIDYSTMPIKDNFFLANKTVLPYAKDMLAFLNLHLDELVQIQNALCEHNAKQELIGLIKQLDSFIDSVARSITTIEERLRL